MTDRYTIWILWWGLTHCSLRHCKMTVSLLWPFTWMRPIRFPQQVIAECLMGNMITGVVMQHKPSPWHVIFPPGFLPFIHQWPPSQLTRPFCYFLICPTGKTSSAASLLTMLSLNKLCDVNYSVLLVTEYSALPLAQITAEKQLTAMIIWDIFAEKGQ